MSHQLFALEEDVFKVIANQKRLEIIQLLHKRELNVGEMVEMLGLRQSNLSQHLTLLRQCKLVTVTKKGREVYYRLSDDHIAEAVQLVYRFLQKQYNLDGVQTDTLFPIVADPVCGMRLSASEAFDSIVQDGRSYFFCASGCKDKFVRQPSL
ncbi:MAG TPA: metalloregulator ArsR/SmtB family transcription factor [Candidatus Saccharimonadales bacterium]|nr:metalloregulator ArsR/SmtB family transcription factor [Candidatus Saccharimonadales bacterium]